MNFDQVLSLMGQLGPVLNPPAIYASEEDKTWGVALSEDLTVLVEYDEAKDCLVLAAELGTPPDGDRTALYELLLRMNYHWETTGGVRMALDGPAGQVVQVFELATEGLEATRLGATVTAFAETAVAWREIIQRAGSAPDAMPEDPPANFGLRA